MKITMAVTLMDESAYSTAPKTFTLRALTPIRSPENPTIHNQPGVVGNQYCM